jgi:hypothetical protein
MGGSRSVGRPEQDAGSTAAREPGYHARDGSRDADPPTPTLESPIGARGVCRSTILIPGQLELDDRTLAAAPGTAPVLLALACLRFDSWVGG